jgi:hypothetical protein
MQTVSPQLALDESVNEVRMTMDNDCVEKVTGWFTLI